MSDQDWQTVAHNRPKKVKQNEQVKFDPIPNRQREAQTKIDEAQTKIDTENTAKKQIKLPAQSNPNQDWNYITLTCINRIFTCII